MGGAIAGAIHAAITSDAPRRKVGNRPQARELEISSRGAIKCAVHPGKKGMELRGVRRSSFASSDRDGTGWDAPIRRRFLIKPS